MSASQFAGTMEVQERQRFDVASLEAWMRDHVEGFRGPVTVERHESTSEAARRMAEANAGIVSLGDLAIEEDSGSALADVSAAEGNI